ncbi:MAG: amino acid ABC transporter permease [Clostridia bacterium]
MSDFQLFNLDKILAVADKYSAQFYQGALYTIAIALGSVLAGLIIALIILPFRRLDTKNTYTIKFIDSENKVVLTIIKIVEILIKIATYVLKFIANAYVEVIRGTPVLVQIFIIYWGVTPIFSPFIPSVMWFGFIDTARYIPGIITIGINCGAYISEILRAGINAVDRGQSEAARSLGMTSTQTMTNIILPQAIKNILPALANEFVTVIKESSILYVIGINEMMNVAKTIGSATYSPIEGYVVAAVIYFAMCFTTSKIIAYFERRMSSGDRR